MKPEQFWRLLDKRFGKTSKAFGDCVEARERGEAANPYPLKNQSLEFANAVAAQFDVAKLRSIGLWLIREQLPMTGKVLEVGCDNGILLCLLASLYPDAQFVGIDSCEEAVVVARQRAANLELTNVEFHVTALAPGLDTVVG